MRNVSLRPSQYLAGAWIAFFVCLVFCIFPAPQIFHENLGISNYATNRLTVLPYSIGCLVPIVLLLLAAYRLPSASITHRRARVALGIVAFLQLGLFLFPDIANDTVRHTHIGIGVTLFTAEFAVGAWVAVSAPAAAFDRWVLGLFGVAGIVSLLSLVHRLPLLAPGEMAFQLSFPGLCVTGVRRLELP
jgi:hypothetical protein